MNINERKPPMTADEARENIAAMRRETPRRARRRLLSIAIGPLGNLSREAIEVYSRELMAMDD